MRENGTDRDVALSIVSMLGTVAENVALINDNLFVPHIVTQPVDFAGTIGENAVFTVVANNVTAYQWQIKSAGGNWVTLGSSYTDPTMTFEVTEGRIGNNYRCRITGKDGSTIYSNVCVLTLAEDDT